MDQTGSQDQAPGIWLTAHSDARNSGSAGFAASSTGKRLCSYGAPA